MPRDATRWRKCRDGIEQEQRARGPESQEHSGHKGSAEVELEDVADSGEAGGGTYARERMESDGGEGRGLALRHGLRCTCYRMACIHLSSFQAESNLAA